MHAALNKQSEGSADIIKMISKYKIQLKNPKNSQHIQGLII